MNEFVVYPAIDLRNGQVVRLVHGDPGRQRIFDSDPLAVAARWTEAGATWLHVVNLDGAFGEAEGARRNWEIVSALVPIGPRIQFGGGLRTLADVERAGALGVARVVLGTAAVEQPQLLGEAVRQFGAQAIAVGLDARQERVKTRGWQAESGLSATALGRRMADLGVRYAIHTDIARDGALAGMDARASAALARVTGLRVIASGGAASLEDVRQCRQLCSAGVAGVILGRALYEGAIDLREALRWETA